VAAGSPPFPPQDTEEPEIDTPSLCSDLFSPKTQKLFYPITPEGTVYAGLS